MPKKPWPSYLGEFLKSMYKVILFEKCFDSKREIQQRRQSTESRPVWFFEVKLTGRRKRVVHTHRAVVGCPHGDVLKAWQTVGRCALAACAQICRNSSVKGWLSLCFLSLAQGCMFHDPPFCHLDKKQQRKDQKAKLKNHIISCSVKYRYYSCKTVQIIE